MSLLELWETIESGVPWWILFILPLAVLIIGAIISRLQGGVKVQ